MNETSPRIPGGLLGHLGITSIATPPNAMVFADGRLQTRDFAVVELIVGAITPLLATLCVGLWFG